MILGAASVTASRSTPPQEAGNTGQGGGWSDLIRSILDSASVPEAWQPMISDGLGVLLILALAFVADLVARRLLVRLVALFVAKSSTEWDDILSKQRVFTRAARIAPALVVYLATPLVLGDTPALSGFVQQVALAYMLIIGVLVLDSVLNALLEIYQTFEIAERVPLLWLVQVFKIVLYILGAILLLSILLQRNPGFFLGGLGAMTAVLMLIFKDSILGFVAGIQLSANQMVRVGDWIEMPQYGANGDVLDVALTTVKVQNWDKTITTIPTYALISSSFKNWRGMSEAGGRRIKRAIHIDMTSVKFCDHDMLERFSRIQFIRDHLEDKKEELRAYNRSHDVDDASLVNGRRITNLGTFRAYVAAYLRNHPKLHHDMTMLVRQLAPTEHGIPIEIYTFSADTAWSHYEAIQSDIFDHILAVIPEFDLHVFQEPTGADFRSLSQIGQPTTR
jgi:miniconductance mechanosensitive channel